jgi:hypothetical protein
MTHEHKPEIERESRPNVQPSRGESEENQAKSREGEEEAVQLLAARRIMREYADTLKMLADS